MNRKTQRKIQTLQKKLELAEVKEKTAYAALEKVVQEFEQLHLEKEAFENLVC